MPATVNGVSIQAMTLRLPLVGSWECTLTADTTDAAKVNGPAVIDIDGRKLTGTAEASADAGGKVTARVIAGANGLAATLAPRSYNPTTVRVVLGHILTDAGETLAADADSATLSRTVDGWTRTAQSGKDALKRLADFLGVAWRHKLDGSVWIGPETWPTVEPKHVVEKEEPTEQAVTVALESLGVLPGETFRAARISAAEYTLDGSKLRLKAKSGSTRDPLAEKFANIIKRETQTDYFALYPARVVRQNADGTIDVKVDSPKMPGMSKLPIRHGVPGVTALEVATGARVLVGFEGAQPSKPYAALWEGASTLTRIRYGGVHEFDGTEAVALESAVASWCSSANTAITAALTAAGSPAPPPGPLTDAASESLFAK
jgi:hypothetical protein